MLEVGLDGANRVAFKSTDGEGEGGSEHPAIVSPPGAPSNRRSGLDRMADTPAVGRAGAMSPRQATGVGWWCGRGYEMAHPTGNGLSMREFDALRRQKPPQGGFFFSNCGAISLTVWPSVASLRAQWWALAQASMPTRQGGKFSKKTAT